jgi:oligogalacturonide transport system substrate-binding protein
MQINWAWLAMFSKRGNGFTDLNLYKDSLDLAQMSKEDLAMGMVAGHLNALSVSYSARIFLWNSASFARVGIPIPRTWEELFSVGKTFQQKLGDKAFPMDGELYDMILLSQAYIHQKYGTPFLDPQQPRVAMSPQAALEWVQIYRRLVEGHVVTPLKLRASLGGANRATEQQPDWVNGNWAGTFTWDSSIGLRQSSMDANQKLAIGDFPMLTHAKSSGMFGRPSVMFAVGRNSKYPAVAAKLINFLLFDAEAASILGRTRGVPLSDRQYQVLVKENKLPELEQRAYLQIKEQKMAGNIASPAPLFEHSRMQKFMREIFETVAYGKTSDQEAAMRLIVEGNALLQRIK